MATLSTPIEKRESKYLLSVARARVFRLIVFRRAKHCMKKSTHSSMHLTIQDALYCVYFESKRITSELVSVDDVFNEIFK